MYLYAYALKFVNNSYITISILNAVCCTIFANSCVLSLYTRIFEDPSIKLKQKIKCAEIFNY